MREGIRLLMERDAIFQQQIRKLNQEIEIGLIQLENGEGIPGTQIFQEINEMSKNRMRKIQK